jgi:alanine racemase
MKIPSTSWLEISKSALLYNFKQLKQNLSPKTKTLCVIKGNAYGHDLKTIVSILKKTCPDFYGVFNIQDALIIRQSNKKTPILVMCPAQKEFVAIALKHNLSLSVSSNEVLSQIVKKKLSKPLKIHLCIETGLGRDGIPHQELSRTLALIHNKENIIIEGLYTHFSGAESRKFDLLTRTQIRKLLEWESAFQNLGIKPIAHASGTAGSFLGTQFQLDMCRIGLGLYGLWPSDETQAIAKETALKPVLSWKTKIVDIKELPKNHGIGYDVSFITHKPTKVAVVPVGYYDGIPRSATNKAWMLVQGQKIPLRGKVMMNMCVLDVTALQVKIGDEVVIIGTQEKSSVTAEEWAEWSGTINYEIVTKINPLLPRKLVK